MKNYSYKLFEQYAFRRVKLRESNNNKSSHMDTLLLSIPPNALETLILESISVDDVLNSEHIESHLLLGKNGFVAQRF